MRTRIVGAIAFIWGGLVLLRHLVEFLSGAVDFSSFNITHWSALFFAFVMCIAGAYYLFRPKGKQVNDK